MREMVCLKQLKTVRVKRERSAKGTGTDWGNKRSKLSYPFARREHRRLRKQEGRGVGYCLPNRGMSLSSMRWVPKTGQRFKDDLCDDCRKIVRNE